jgi:hypothetical protein
MEAPKDVEIGLRSIRPAFRLQLNKQGKLVGGHSFDVNGNAREREYEPRWELWDTDVHGNDYRVAVIQDKDGGFMPPTMKFVEFMNLVNPEKYGGDASKMIQALVDSPNDQAASLGAQTFENLVEYLGDVYFTQNRPMVRGGL